MADKYPNFEALSRNEPPGDRLWHFGSPSKSRVCSYRAPWWRNRTGNVRNRGTPSLAKEFSFYAFDGLKRSRNADLHITSTHFDEPMCLTLIDQSEVVIAIHGEASEDGEGVFLGGLDDEIGLLLAWRSRPAALMFASTQIPGCRGMSRITCATGESPAKASSWSFLELFEGKCSHR